MEAAVSRDKKLLDEREKPVEETHTVPADEKLEAGDFVGYDREEE